jgi:phage protein D
MSVSGAVGKMKVVGWNPETKEQIVGSAQSDALAGSMGGDFGVDISDTVFGERTVVESDVPVVNQTEADQIALGQLQSLALEWIKGDGEAVGNPEIRAGEVITLTGLGNQFSGEYYLDCVEHTVSPEFGFKTNFHAVRNAS